MFADVVNNLAKLLTLVRMISHSPSQSRLTYLAKFGIIVNLLLNFDKDTWVNQT
jgi:hypothetical protein